MSYVKYNFVCIGAIGLGNGFFDNRDVVAGVSNVQCTGDEISLSECNMTDIDGSQCSHYAGVLCRGEYW